MVYRWACDWSISADRGTRQIPGRQRDSWHLKDAPWLSTGWPLSAQDRSDADWTGCITAAARITKKQIACHMQKKIIPLNSWHFLGKMPFIFGNKQSVHISNNSTFVYTENWIMIWYVCNQNDSDKISLGIKHFICEYVVISSSWKLSYSCGTCT